MAFYCSNRLWIASSRVDGRGGRLETEKTVIFTQVSTMQADCVGALTHASLGSYQSKTRAWDDLGVELSVG